MVQCVGVRFQRTHHHHHPRLCPTACWGARGEDDDDVGTQTTQHEMEILFKLDSVHFIQERSLLLTSFTFPSDAAAATASSAGESTCCLRAIHQVSERGSASGATTTNERMVSGQLMGENHPRILQPPSLLRPSLRATLHGKILDVVFNSFAPRRRRPCAYMYFIYVTVRIPDNLPHILAEQLRVLR